jgi:hypothetical protein
MRASRIDPTRSTHEVLKWAYDWNRYPLAPLGCKAVVYKDGDTRGSWASRGVDGWYLGPSKDHYRCDIYYIPETRGYRISGSTDLFPQHCQLPDMTPHQHFRALVDKMSDDVDRQSTTPKGRRILNLLQTRLTTLLAPPPTAAEQRVIEDRARMASNGIRREDEQRVIDEHPIITIPRITDAPGIIEVRNPTAKRRLRETPRLHWRTTRNNTPGLTSPPVAPAPSPVTLPIPIQSRTSPRVAIPTKANQRLVRRHAINMLTDTELTACNRTFTP